jgi:CPA2 family monovalent cation:H+ antiporter-2
MGSSEIFSAFLITTISLTVVSTLLWRLKVPTVIGFVLTGIVIGPSGLNWIGSVPAATMLAELGVALLMFSLGLEISIDQLRRLVRPLLLLGFNQVLFTTVFGAAILALIFGVNLRSSLLCGALMALSSTAVVLKLLQEQRETESPHGRASIIILLFQDIAALPLMIGVPFLAVRDTGVAGFATVMLATGKIVLFLAGCILAGHFLVPKVFAEVVRTRSREVFFFLLISFTLVVAFLAEKVGLSVSLGAFIAGVLISESPYNKQALAELSPFRDVFLGLFFASIGMMLNLSFVAENLAPIFLLIPLLFASKFAIIYGVMRGNRQSHGVSLSTALALCQIGEFSFVLAAAAFSHGILSEKQFQYFLALAVLSLLFTPALFRLAMKSSAHQQWPELAETFARAFRLGSDSESTAAALEKSETSAPTSHSLLAPRQAMVIGLGHTGQRVLKLLHANGVPCLGVDLNQKLLSEVHAHGLRAVYGDATRREVLEESGIHNCYLVVITVNGRDLAARILSVVHHLEPKARAVVRVQYLLDMDYLKMESNDVLVIAESETARSVETAVLRAYDLQQDKGKA